MAPYPLGDFYFSPLKVFEYMAAALPVAASRIGQLEEVIDDCRTGLLYEPGDVNALTAALHRLIAAPELRRRLGAAARAALLTGHCWDRVLARSLAGLQDQPARAENACGELV